MSEREKAQPGWRPSEIRPPLCGRPHGAGKGRLDEAARRLTHEELAVGRQLAAEGHDVRSLRERPGAGPVADFEVCGALVEVKSFLHLPDRPGRVPSSRALFNKLVQAERQGSTVIVYGCGSGLTEGAANAGVGAYGERARCGKIQAIRVIGDGFDLSWSRQLGLRWRREQGHGGDRAQGNEKGRGRGQEPDLKSRGRPDPGCELGW